MIEELTECKHENACLNGGIQTQLDKLESRLDAGEAMNQQQNSGIYHISLNSFRRKYFFHGSYLKRVGVKIECLKKFFIILAMARHLLTLGKNVNILHSHSCLE